MTDRSGTRTSTHGTKASPDGKPKGVSAGSIFPDEPVEVKVPPQTPENGEAANKTGSSEHPRPVDPSTVGPAHWLAHRLVTAGLLDQAAIVLPEGESQFSLLASFPEITPKPRAEVTGNPEHPGTEEPVHGWIDAAVVAAERVTGLGPGVGVGVGQGTRQAGPVVMPRVNVGGKVDADQQGVIVAFDLTFGGDQAKALVGTLGPMDRSVLVPRLKHIELVSLLSRLHDTERDAELNRASLHRVAGATEVAAAVSRHEHFRASALELCDQVAALWRLRRVSLGITHPAGVKLEAVNGVEHFVRRMNATQSLEAVMDECADQGEVVVYPTLADAAGQDVVAREAKRHGQEHRAGQVCSVPFALGGSLGGVLTLETEPGELDAYLDDRAIDAVEVILDLCGGTVVQRYRSSRWFGARWLAGCRRNAASWVGPTHTWLKVVGLCLALFLVFLVVGKGTYRVDAPFVVEPVKQYVLAAPFEGELESSAVVPGAVVTAGQPLAQLRTTELRVELASRRAEQRRWVEESDLAIREGKSAESQIAQAKSDQAAADIELLELRLNRASIKSPVDGVVIEGDLRKRVGGTLSLGDAMFEVAPLTNLQARVLVPEGRIADVTAGQRGEIAVAANPSQRVAFTVSRVEPMAQVKENLNVFPVWIELDERPDWLMPGMEGVAKVDVDRRRYAWIWTRSAVDWMRMKLWW